MDPVRRQYEDYPYPSRDPADEKKRLITGSPSHPVEIDHFIFGGKRDWSAPFRVLVAGGGTGDALVMLAQLLNDRKTPAEIHYLDLSTSSRAVAEARIAARGLSNVSFHTGDLLTAPELGPFDYIDCCGVLHHLPNPQAGFDALAAALSPEGGLGGMVYAPYGRSGVYPLQEAFGAAFAQMSPADKVAAARETLEQLPPSHPFRLNPLLGDHASGDAGLYDLLLHSTDRAYLAGEVIESLEHAGLKLSNFVEPARYDPRLYLGAAAAAGAEKALREMSPADRATLAEKLAGNIKTHLFYATPASRNVAPASLKPDLIPVLHKIDARALANSVHKTGKMRFVADGLTIERPVNRALAPLLAAIDGRTKLGSLQQRAGIDWLAFAQAVAPAFRALDGFNILRYSTFLAS
ncbi:MAG: class I SAM-dependent methyltransferase [Neomegalonema sp.]|nr:class I SAM-dependent methyltransferase [Neomegalonema sp.]